MFTSQGGLKELVGNISEYADLLRKLSECIEDCGGNVNHLNELLKDARNNREVLTEIAKLIVGPIWDLTENAVEIDYGHVGSVGYDEYKQFMDVYAYGLNVLSGFECRSATFTWSQGRHPASGKYILGHYYDLDMMRIAEHHEHYTHATWPELVAYAAKLAPYQFSGCAIIAAGSVRVNVSQDDQIIFPAAYAVNDQIHLGWKKTKHDKLGKDCFCLLRLA